jgi:signal peptidase I
MNLFPFVSYKFSQKTFRQLQKKGLSDETIRQLHPLEDQFFETPEELCAALPESAAIQNNTPLLLKSAKGYFRLDRLIPNRSVREWVEALLFALIVASVVRTYLFAPFKIPSGSMLPTIQIGDHIFATMYSYGTKLPIVGIRLFEDEVQRGDIIIFPYPKNRDVDYIKRAVGMPGETLEIRDDVVFINGERLDEPYAFYDPQQRNSGMIGDDVPVSNFGPVKIPEGKLFVMGDNRYNSADSRFWGFVDSDDVLGKGQIIYWSHDPREGLTSGYNLSRILNRLE